MAVLATDEKEKGIKQGDQLQDYCNSAEKKIIYGSTVTRITCMELVRSGQILKIFCK